MKDYCIICKREIKEELLVCKECQKQNPITFSIYKILYSERVLPDPFTYWDWDRVTAKVLWELAQKIWRII